MVFLVQVHNFQMSCALSDNFFFSRLHAQSSGLKWWEKDLEKGLCDSKAQACLPDRPGFRSQCGIQKGERTHSIWEEGKYVVWEPTLKDHDIQRI